MLNIIYLLEVSSNKKDPHKVDNNDPDNTPILTPSMYEVFSANAKFPTNKLIVKPIPVNIETPYKLTHFELSGSSAIFNLTDK